MAIKLGWSVGLVTWRDSASFLKQNLNLAFNVDLGDRPRDIFMVEVEKEAKDLVGPVLEHEVEKGIELRGSKASLNCVLSQMGLVYEEHKVHLKRRTSKMLIGFLPSLRCRRILR